MEDAISCWKAVHAVPASRLGLFRFFVQEKELDVRNVVREKPYRVAPIRAEMEDRFALKQHREGGYDQRRVTSDRAIDTDSVDTPETRELDVPDARRPVTLELDPQVRQEVGPHRSGFAEPVSRDSGEHGSDDLPVLNGPAGVLA